MCVLFFVSLPAFYFSGSALSLWNMRFTPSLMRCAFCLQPKIPIYHMNSTEQFYGGHRSMLPALLGCPPDGTKQLIVALHIFCKGSAMSTWVCNSVLYCTRCQRTISLSKVIISRLHHSEIVDESADTRLTTSLLDKTVSNSAKCLELA